MDRQFWPNARRLAAAAVLALISGACADDAVTNAVAPEDTQLAVTQQFTDLEGAIFWNNCTGEYVQFAEGSTRHDVTSSRDDGAGGYHVMVHRNGQHYHGPGLEWTGSGFVPTGTEYVGNSVLNYSINAKPPFPAEYTFSQNVRVMQKGSGPNSLFHIVDHITVNANGDVTADVLDAWFACQ